MEKGMNNKLFLVFLAGIFLAGCASAGVTSGGSAGVLPEVVVFTSPY